jgi:hypothetical protein
VKNAARIIALGRAAFSVAYIAVPSRINESWLGQVQPGSKADMLARSLAARDLALSIGALIALDDDDARPELWFASHALADATDFASSVALRGTLPDSGARNGAITAGLSAVAAGTVAVLLARS